MNANATAARRAYKREWARKNPDKIRAQQERYWTRRAAEAAAADTEDAVQTEEPSAQHPADKAAAM